MARWDFLESIPLMFKRLSYITIKEMTVLDKDELKFVMNQANGIRVVIATK